jgi:rubrerythrin
MVAVGKTLAGTFKGILVAALATLVGATLLSAGPKEAVSTATMQNLNTALNGERNAYAKYLAFAQKADEEGYGAVASLFRAVAAAEEIHGNNHEQTIQRLGGVPAVKLDPPVVKSTQENLEVSVSGETYERKTMYPEFIAQARQDRYVPAIVAFENAQRTEEEHAMFFAEVLRNLDSLKGSTARTYYVCTVCGFTTADLNFEKCRSCFKPKSKYKAVS